MKIAIIAFLAFSVCGFAKMQTAEIHKQIVALADFEVTIQTAKLEKFDIGLGLESDGGIRRLYIGREECVPFFRKQKRKECIVVSYPICWLEGDPLRAELIRTVEYFETAGYKRVIIVQIFGAFPEVEVHYDTAKEFSDNQKTEPNKAMEPSRVAVTDHAGACSAPATRLAHLGRSAKKT